MTTKRNGVASGANTPTTNVEADVFELIDPRLIDASPFQHRTVFDAAELDELRADIEKHGIHLPLIVRRHPNDSRQLTRTRLPQLVK
jgi:hypothetical protein